MYAICYHLSLSRELPIVSLERELKVLPTGVNPRFKSKDLAEHSCLCNLERHFPILEVVPVVE
jgi:hypothetical protein